MVADGKSDTFYTFFVSYLGFIQCTQIFLFWGFGMNTDTQVNIQSVYVKLSVDDCRHDYRIQSEKVSLFDDKQRVLVY
jgi:hypothetical protein